MAQTSLGAPGAAARPGGRQNTTQSPDRWARSTPPANLRLAPGRSPVPPPGRLPPPRALCPAPPGSAGQQRPRKGIGRRTAAGPSTGQGRAGVPRKAVGGSPAYAAREAAPLPRPYGEWGARGSPRARGHCARPGPPGQLEWEREGDVKKVRGERTSSPPRRASGRNWPAPRRFHPRGNFSRRRLVELGSLKL